MGIYRSQSPEADRLIYQYESGSVPRLVAYLDSGGVWTIGRGHTRGVHAGMRITEDQELEFYREDVAHAIATIYANVPAEIIESWPQLCYDAMVSFVFNVDEQAFTNPKTGKRTDFWRAVMSGDLTAVPKQMQRWVKDNGRVLPGLVERRGAEAALWGRGIELARAHAESESRDDFARERDRIEQQTRVVPDVPPSPKVIEQPAIAGAAAAGGVGVATVATTLTTAGTSMTAQNSTVAIVLGVVFILAGVIVLMLIAKGR